MSGTEERKFYDAIWAYKINMPGHESHGELLPDVVGEDWNFLMIVSVIFSLFALTKLEISRIEGIVLFTFLIASLIYIFKNSN